MTIIINPGSLDYSTLSLPDVSSGGLERFGEQFDDNPQNLFDFDDIINKQAKVSSSNLVLQQDMLLGEAYVDNGFKNASDVSVFDVSFLFAICRRVT